MFLQNQLRALSVGTQSSHSSNKVANDTTTNKAPQSTVTCVYQTYITGCWRNVTIVWSRNYMNHYLSLIVNSLDGEICYSCKIDVTPWNLWTKKGSKSFMLDECQVVLYWNLSSVKFSSGPEPSSDYYVALVSNEEVVLLLGDRKERVFRKTKARPTLADPSLFYKQENVFAKKCFATKGKLDDRKQEHDIVVESCTTGPNHPQMWISIDGLIVIHVKNLQWNFRGNQTVFVNKQPLQVFWDVHDWFNNSGSGHGLFVFKFGAPDSEHDERSSQGTSNSDASGHSKDSSTKSDAAASDFCLLLYACKIK